MKCLFLLLMKFILVLNLYSKDLYEYKFNWYPRIIVEDDVILFPKYSGILDVNENIYLAYPISSLNT